MPARCGVEGGGIKHVGDRKLSVGVVGVNDSGANSICRSDESSSIGKNSDISENSMGKSEDFEEVQSNYEMESLEQVLPIRRGISGFYNGKSKSYASLMNASLSSIKDIAKIENAYTRRRRNLLACSLTWDRTRSSSLRANVIGGGVAKKTANSSRTALALAVATRNSEGDNLGKACDFTASSWRSFSFGDLQRCDASSNEVAREHS